MARRVKDYGKGGGHQAFEAEEKRDYAVKAGLTPPRLMTCPNLWCNSSWYSEATDDLGRTEGYCMQCGYERAKAKLG